MARAPGAHGKQQFGIGAFVPLGLQGVAADTPSGPGTPVIVTVDDPLPQQAIRYVAAIAAVAISSFVSPPSAPARAATISAAWAPADPAPQRPNVKMAAFTPQAPGDSPSGAVVPKIVILPDDPLPQVNAKLPQTYVPPTPAFTRHLEVLGAWAPITFSITSPAKIAAFTPSLDSPPPIVRHPEILAAWTPPDPAAILPPKEAAFAPSVDNPPPLARRLDTILATWVAPLPAVILPPKEAAIAIPAADNPPPLKRSQDWTPWDVAIPVKLVVSSAATAGATVIPADNPPFNQRRLQDWFHWFDAVPVRLVVSDAATAGAAVTPPPSDNPPFGLHRFTAWGWGPLVGYPGGGGQFVPAPSETAPITRPWLDIIVRAWSPADPLPTLTRKLPRAGVAIVPDNPPGSGIPRIVAVPDDPLPQVSRKLPQGAPPDLHDQPPFTQRRTQDWTHWFQPYPLPTLRVLQTPPSGPEVITPPPIVTPPGGVGMRVGRYKQLKLRKKLKRDECEELLAYLRSLPPAELQIELEELQPQIASLLEMIPAATSVLTPAQPVEDDDDEDCIALLLEILNS